MIVVPPSPFNWQHASWEEGIQEAHRYVDALGCSIDTGILETVVALNFSGFPTVAACEGHLDFGCPFPWIDFETEQATPALLAALEAVNRTYENEIDAEAAANAYLEQQSIFHHPGHLYSRLQAVLDAYYQHYHDILYEDQLFVWTIKHGEYRLMTGAGFSALTWTMVEKANKLAYYQQDMNRFTAYLKKQLPASVIAEEVAIS